MGDSPELVPTEVATDLGTDGFTDAESAEMDLSGTLAMPPSTDGRGLVLEENAAAANVFAPNAPSPFVGLGAPQIHMYRQQFQQNITIGETPEQTRLLLTELENEAESRHQRFRLAAEEAHDQQIADVEEGLTGSTRKSLLDLSLKLLAKGIALSRGPKVSFQNSSNKAR